MPLDRQKLDIVREENGCIYARCPACAELGEDRKKQHLVIFEDGAYYCHKYGDDDEHKQRIWQLAGLHNKKQNGALVAIPRYLPPTRKPEYKPLPKLPRLAEFYRSDCRVLCRTRGWSEAAFPGLFELSDRGLLRFTGLRDDGQWHAAWVILDSSRRSAQAKNMSGQAWNCGKVKSLYGSWGDWTIGAPDIGSRPIVVLCEGMPDFVAVLCVAHLERIPLDAIAPVCIAGAAHLIHADTLPHFAGKRVRIFAHPDAAGQRSAQRWAKQLETVNAKVGRFTFHGIVRKDGVPVKDLADYLTLLDDKTDPSAFVLRDLWKEVLEDDVGKWTP